MRKIGKIVLIMGIWIIGVILLLEVLLRLAAPVLPGRIAAAVRHVTTGRAYPEGYRNPWEYDDEHYTIVKPGLQNVLQYGTPAVSFHLTTYSLWGSRAGFRVPSSEVDYFVDALFIGDSHTFCFTELADCWTTHLMDSTGIRGLNFGQPVTGSLSHLRYLEAYGPSVEPPLVIWQFVGNDFNDDYGLSVLRGELEEIPVDYSDAPQPPERSAFVRWLDSSSVLWGVYQMLTTGRIGGLTADDMLHYDPYTILYNDPEGVPHQLQFGRYIERQVADMDNPRNQAGLTLTRDALEQGRDLTEGWGGTFVVLLVPTRELVYRHLTEPILGAEQWQIWYSSHAAALEACADLDLLCLDALPALQAYAEQGEHLYWTDDPHLNPRGNELLAVIVEDFLREQALLPER